MRRKRINVSTVLAGRRLGAKEVEEGIRIVSFISYDLASSIWSRKPRNRSTTRSARGCHLIHVLGADYHLCIPAGHSRS
jgi:hypothetical protein